MAVHACLGVSYFSKGLGSERGVERLATKRDPCEAGNEESPRLQGVLHAPKRTRTTTRLSRTRPSTWSPGLISSVPHHRVQPVVPRGRSGRIGSDGCCRRCCRGRRSAVSASAAPAGTALAAMPQDRGRRNAPEPRLGTRFGDTRPKLRRPGAPAAAGSISPQVARSSSVARRDAPARSTPIPTARTSRRRDRVTRPRPRPRRRRRP